MQHDDKPNKEPKQTSVERIDRTDAAFREIVQREKLAEDAKTARLREARLKRDAEKPQD